MLKKCTRDGHFRLLSWVYLVTMQGGEQVKGGTPRCRADRFFFISLQQQAGDREG